MAFFSWSVSLPASADSAVWMAASTENSASLSATLSTYLDTSS